MLSCNCLTSKVKCIVIKKCSNPLFLSYRFKKNCTLGGLWSCSQSKLSRITLHDFYFILPPGQARTVLIYVGSIQAGLLNYGAKADRTRTGGNCVQNSLRYQMCQHLYLNRFVLYVERSVGIVFQ